MALLKVYDVTQKPPNDLVSSQNIADVFDSSMNVVYMR